MLPVDQTPGTAEFRREASRGHDPATGDRGREDSPKMQAIHRAHHPLEIHVYVWVRSHYEIYFYYHGKRDRRPDHRPAR